MTRMIFFILACLALAIISIHLYERHINAPLSVFQNPPGSPEIDRDAAKESWRKFFWDRLTDHAKISLPQGFVVPEPDVIAALKSGADRNSVTWLGHAAFLIRLDGKTILTDPFLSQRASPFRYLLGPKRFSPPGLQVENLPPIDIILISHNHYDHLDKETLRKIPNKDRITIATPSRNGIVLRPLGFTHVTELGWGDDTKIDGLDITAMPSIHFSARSLWDRNRMLWGGFSIKGTKKLYFSGDTAYGPVFKTMEKYGPFDFGMIAIGAYEPVDLMKAAHVTPEQAVEIGKDLQVGTIIGMHWGSVKLTTEDPFEPPKRFVAAGEKAGYAPAHLWAMKIGETREIK